MTKLYLRKRRLLAIILCFIMVLSQSGMTLAEDDPVADTNNNAVIVSTDVNTNTDVNTDDDNNTETDINIDDDNTDIDINIDDNNTDTDANIDDDNTETDINIDDDNTETDINIDDDNTDTDVNTDDDNTGTDINTDTDVNTDDDNNTGTDINTDTDINADVGNDELILVTDEIADLLDIDDEAEVAYDLQPESIEEVQAWIDKITKAFTQAGGADDFLEALDAMDAVKPRWEFEVDASLIPDGWYCAEAEDDNGDPLYWTLFAIAVPELLADADATLKLEWRSSVGTTTGDSLTVTPSNNSTQTVKLKLTFKLIDVDADEDDIVIKIPKSIFYNRSGTATGSISIPLPLSPATDGPTSFNYSIEGDYIVIKNYAQLTAGDSFTTDIEYTFEPYLIQNGYTKSDIQASVTVFPGEQDEITCTSNELSVKVNTSARIGGISKESPVKYEKWQSSWGTAPDDADDYFYITWRIYFSRSIAATQPYTVTFVDNPAPGTVVGYSTSSNGSGAATTSSISHTENVPSTSYSTTWNRYVVVQYPRTLLTGDSPTTEFTNTITANLQGTDEGTTDSREATSTSYTYQSINFDYSGDTFSLNKSYTGSNNNYGAINAIEKDESVRVGGGANYDFSIFTTSKGWDLTKDAAGTYGEETYTIEMIDDLLYLENEALEPADYSISAFYLSLTEYDYSEDNDKGIVALSNWDYDTYSPIEVWYTTDNTDSTSWQRHGTVTTTDDGYQYTYSDGGHTATVNVNNKINLPDNCGVKFVHQSSRFQVYIAAYLDVTLNPTDHVKGLIQNKSSVSLNNIGTLLIKDKGDNIVNPVGGLTLIGTIAADVQSKDNSKYGKDVQHATTQLTLQRLTAATTMTKTAGTVTRDAANKLERLPYTITAYESGSYSSASLSVEEAKALGFVANQKEGVFYDLLPAGMTADIDNLRVSTYHTTAGRGTTCERTVELKDNWQGSGQTMMIVKVTAPGDQNYFDPDTTTASIRSGFVLQYTLVCTWQNLKDYSTFQRNSVAYRAGEGTLTGGNTANSSTLYTTIKQYFSDLNDDGAADDTEKNTVYAQSTTTLSYIEATQDGIQKMVKAADRVAYGDTAEVPATGTYTYQLRFGNRSDEKAKDLIFYDVLETAYGSNPFWQGTLVSIDTSYAVSKGIKPVVYYSLVSGLDPYTSNTDADLATATWKKWDDMPVGFNLGNIKAIAIDFSKKTNTDDYILDGVASMLCYVTMLAPANYKGFIDSDIVYAYNKASYSVTIVGYPTSKGECLATKVSLREPDIKIQKTSDPASGTESAPTYVSSGTTINYDVSLRNTNAGGEAITNIKCTDKIPTGLTVDTSEIKFYFGTDPGSAALVAGNTSGVSVSWASDNQTLEFTVDRLTAAQTVHFIIPAVVGSGTQSLIKNTAIITELNKYSGFDIESDPTYHGVSKALQLTGIKAMSGRMLTAADEFTFIVKEGSTTVATGANNGTGTITFTPIVYTAAGTHTYTVTEDATTIPNVSIDTGSCDVEVEVTANASSGELTAAVVSGTIQFTNTYEIISPATVNLTGTKTLSGRDLAAGEFSFLVTEAAASGNADTVATGTNDANGLITFTPLTYSSGAAAGTHTYTVSEVNNGLGGVTYAATTFTVTVEVTDDGSGTLTATPTYPAGGIVFSNSYEVIDFDGHAAVNLTGTKILSGRNLIAGEFSFKVTESDASNHVNIVATGTTDADGLITFTPLGYTLLSDKGTHTYTVSEVDNGLGGVTYAATTFTVTVEVTDDGNGTLTAIPTYPAGGIVFSNSYSIDPTGHASIALAGTKKLTGRTLKEGEFSFIVKDEAGNTVSTTTNNADGTIVFTPIGYAAAGTYIYQVSEVNNRLNRVIYDTTEHTVRVTVVDNGNGTLTATPIYPESGIVFNNRYTSGGGGGGGGGGGTTPTQPGTEAPAEPSTEETAPTVSESQPTPEDNRLVEIPGNPPSVIVVDPNGNTIYEGPTDNGYLDTNGWTPGTYTVYLLDHEGVPLGQMQVTITDDKMPAGLAKTGDTSLTYAFLMVIMLGAVGSMTALVLKRRKE